MNQITVSNTVSNVPTATPPNMERCIRFLSSKLFEVGLGHEIPATDAPTAEQRDGLERRAMRINQWLTPDRSEHGAKAIKELILTVLGTMSGRSGNDLDAEVQAAIYVADLIDIPYFAIAGACRDYRQGRMGDKKWAPTQAELREGAEKHLYPIVKEARSIDLILKAKVVDTTETAAHRKLVIEGYQARLKSMRDAGLDAERQRDARMSKEPPPPPSETHDEAEARWKSPIPPLSQELRAKFGTPDQEVAA